MELSDMIPYVKLVQFIIVLLPGQHSKSSLNSVLMIVEQNS